MVDYDKDVKEDAERFIDESEDDVIETLIEHLDNYNSAPTIEDVELDDRFHEVIIDRAYTPGDAIYVIENCENEEDDSGLWEGLEWYDVLSAKAAYSYGNDVREQCNNILEEIFEDAENLRDEFGDDELTEKFEELDELEEYIYDGISNKDDEKDYYTLKAKLLIKERPMTNKEAATRAFKEFFTTSEFEPITPGSQEEIILIKQWLRMNDNAGMRGGYPVGGSYIDARCGIGYEMPDVKDYVDFDHEFAEKVPHLRGKYREAIEARLKELTKSETHKQLEQLKDQLASIIGYSQLDHVMSTVANWLNDEGLMEKLTQ